MEKYDVIIVGAGPAGLKCAEVLGNAGKKVLLLEKNPEIGPKVCAGGLTRKCFRYLNLPPELIQNKFQDVTFISRCNRTKLEFGEDLAYTINRKDLGQWQLSKINTANVYVKTNSSVTEITKEYVKVNKNEVYGYDFLVGADGANSIVRKYLNIKTQLLGVAYQYILPQTYKNLEIYFDSRIFYCWYAWIFPYNKKTSVGSGYFPVLMNGPASIKKFNKWAEEKGIDIQSGEFQAYPINIDYRGYQFGSVFLAGEAAGLANKYSGEGIYPALVSGEEIAKLIIDPAYKCVGIKEVLKEIRINSFMLGIVWIFGPLRDYLFAFVVWAVKNKHLARLLLRILT
jgi:geranylgeranyl reductase family protein